MSRDELIQHLAIRMAAANRNPPILRGKAAPRDPWERDQFRQDFATWFVEECIDRAGLKVMTDRPARDEITILTHGTFPQVRSTGTPPQRFAV